MCVCGACRRSYIWLSLGLRSQSLLQRWWYFSRSMRLIISVFCKYCIVCVFAGEGPLSPHMCTISSVHWCCKWSNFGGIWRPPQASPALQRREEEEREIERQGEPGQRSNQKNLHLWQADAELTEEKLQRLLPPFAVCLHYFLGDCWLAIMKPHVIFI